jgi:hypothetical protein
VHQGTLADVDQTYGALGTYVAQREIGVDGPIREHYLVTQFDTDVESGLVTEVCWPVFQTVPSSGSGPSPAAAGTRPARGKRDGPGSRRVR